MAKPSDFFVGVLDFFAILLPGAIAAALLAPRVPLFSGLLAAPPGDAGQWALFLVAAYFLGHLVFLAGSWLDGPYNRLRERLNPYGNESAYQCATRIRDGLIDASERQALNTFQWARSVLLHCAPAAAADVHRLEADSKFFRSLLVVLLLAAAIWAAEGRGLAALGALALGLPCFLRYYERRLKSTTQAYQHLISLHRLGRLGRARDGAAGA